MDSAASLKVFRTALAVAVFALIPFAFSFGYLAFLVYLFHDYGETGLTAVEWIFALSGLALVVAGTVLMIQVILGLAKREAFGAGTGRLVRWSVFATSITVVAADVASMIESTAFDSNLGLPSTALVAVASFVAAVTATSRV